MRTVSNNKQEHLKGLIPVKVKKEYNGGETMESMSISEIQKACKGELFFPETWKEDYEQETSCVVIDSRKIQKNGIFVAVKGERTDGHNYIHQVFENGAKAVICEEVPTEVTGPCILVKDSLIALKEIAAWYRKNLDCTIIGISGSVGKTSTKELVASVLSEKYKVLKTEGNFNNEIGLPLTVLSIRKKHEVAVLEMGISDFGEMSRLAAIARPEIGILTNIGLCHLENLIDRDGVLKAKTELFEFLDPNGIGVLFGDDDKLATIKEINGRSPIFYGMKENAFIRGELIEEKGLEGSRIRIHTSETDFDAEITMPGSHMITNALCAATVGLLLGLSENEISDGIKKATTISGRSNLIKTERFFILDDCYNANPVSMKAAIDLLATAKKRKVAILGDMFELGAQSDVMHSEIGGYAADKKINLIITIGESSHFAFQKAKEQGGNALWFLTKEEFLSKKEELLQEGDSILVKASHGMKFEEIIKVLVQ